MTIASGQQANAAAVSFQSNMGTHGAAATAYAMVSGTSQQPPLKKSKPNDTLQPIIKYPSQLQVNTSQLSINTNTSTSTGIKFASASSTASSTSPKGSPKDSTISSTSQYKLLERGQIAQREIQQMDDIERAFREDNAVWNGPSNVIYPRRYHTISTSTEDEEGKKKSNIANPYLSYYGSKSQGWMYGEGFAGIGGKSWMEAVNASSIKEKKLKSSKSKSNNKSFLMDDISIIDNALKSNGLSHSDITPKAYSCLLEQARRYALELIANSQDYAIHAQRSSISQLLPCDLLLAVELSEAGKSSGDNNLGGGINGVASTLPSPSDISDLANIVNAVPLPTIPNNCYNGVALPPVKEQLTARTYDVVNGARVSQRMMKGGDLPFDTIDHGDYSSGGGLIKKKNKGGSYGAGLGRQIAVHIKDKDGNNVSSGGGDSSSSAPAVKKKKGQKRGLTEL